MIKFFLSFIMVLRVTATVMAQKEDKSFDIIFVLISPSLPDDTTV
jgi:hypothetical protein